MQANLIDYFFFSQMRGQVSNVSPKRKPKVGKLNTSNKGSKMRTEVVQMTTTDLKEMHGFDFPSLSQEMFINSYLFFSRTECLMSS